MTSHKPDAYLLLLRICRFPTVQPSNTSPADNTRCLRHRNQVHTFEHNTSQLESKTRSLVIDIDKTKMIR